MKPQPMTKDDLAIQGMHGFPLFPDHTPKVDVAPMADALNEALYQALEVEGGEATGASSHPDAETLLRLAFLDTPLGPLLAGYSNAGLRILEFFDEDDPASTLERLRRRYTPRTPAPAEVLQPLQDQLATCFEGTPTPCRVPLDLRGTPFQQHVWQALGTIPWGQMRSYGALSQQIGRPRAIRAIAAAIARNPIAIIVPCHRVVGADGSLTGYAGGIWRKRALLALEQGHGPDEPPRPRKQREHDAGARVG